MPVLLPVGHVFSQEKLPKRLEIQAQTDGGAGLQPAEQGLGMLVQLPQPVCPGRSKRWRGVCHPRFGGQGFQRQQCRAEAGPGQIAHMGVGQFKRGQSRAGILQVHQAP